MGGEGKFGTKEFHKSKPFTCFFLLGPVVEIGMANTKYVTLSLIICSPIQMKRLLSSLTFPLVLKVHEQTRNLKTFGLLQNRLSSIINKQNWTYSQKQPLNYNHINSSSPISHNIHHKHYSTNTTVSKSRLGNTTSELRLVEAVKIGMVNCCFGWDSLSWVIFKHFLQVQTEQLLIPQSWNKTRTNNIKVNEYRTYWEIMQAAIW